MSTHTPQIKRASECVFLYNEQLTYIPEKPYDDGIVSCNLTVSNEAGNKQTTVGTQKNRTTSQREARFVIGQMLSKSLVTLTRVSKSKNVLGIPRTLVPVFLNKPIEFFGSSRTIGVVYWFRDWSLSTFYPM